MRTSRLTVFLPLAVMLCLDVVPVSAQPLRPGERAPRPPLLSDVLALARQLATIPTEVDDIADRTPAPTPGDRNSPSIGLRLLIDELAVVLARADRGAAPALHEAHEAAADAWRLYAAG